MKRAFLLPIFFLILFSGCLPKEDEESLNYNDISDFYGTWQIYLDENSFGSNYQDGYNEYIQFLPNGTARYLKVYNPEFYPDGMKDYKEYTWTVEANTLSWTIVSFHIDYCGADEIYISGNAYQAHKLRRVTDELIDFYMNPAPGDEDKSVDAEGNILNYKSISDFYGAWQLLSEYTSPENSYLNGYTEYICLWEDGKMAYIKVYNPEYYPAGMKDYKEFNWSLNLNSLRWDAISYYVDYCHPDELGLVSGSVLYKWKRISAESFRQLIEE